MGLYNPRSLNSHIAKPDFLNSLSNAQNTDKIHQITKKILITKVSRAGMIQGTSNLDNLSSFSHELYTKRSKCREEGCWMNNKKKQHTQIARGYLHQASIAPSHSVIH